MAERELEREREREIVIWLAGLLSTDGSIIRFRTGSLGFVLYTTEQEWAELITERLSEIGIETSISIRIHNSRLGFEREFYIRLKKPYHIARLLKRYGLRYLNPRKRRVLESGYKSKRGTHWTKEEEEFLKMNYKKLTLEELAKTLNRGSKNNISLKLKRMGLSKRCR